MKRIILVAFCLLSSIGIIKAQEERNALVIWHADNTQTRLELSTRPQVTFSTDSVNVVSTSVSLKYAMSDVLRFSYAKVPSGIQSTNSDLTLRMNGENIYFVGVNSTDKIKLYSLDGKQMPLNLQPTSIGLCMPLSGLPSGVYLVNVNGRTSKFIKR